MTQITIFVDDALAARLNALAGQKRTSIERMLHDSLARMTERSSAAPQPASPGPRDWRTLLGDDETAHLDLFIPSFP